MASVSAWASPVDAGRARAVAGMQSLYVFAAKDGGFVVVSGDDISLTAQYEQLQGDVLGYCTEHSSVDAVYSSAYWGIRLPASRCRRAYIWYALQAAPPTKL